MSNKKITVYAPTVDANVKKQRVAAYCRVSTDSSDQRTSYDAQKLYFQRLLHNSKEYELVDIYADIGISGTKYERPEFMRMLDDARCGKIDRVMCKSISRFARNTRDCLTALRELKRLGITVKFEKEGIDTARVTDEIMITIMEGLAQEESRSISNNIRWSLRKRMERGTLKIARVPYGYQKDKHRNLIIEEEKAAVVRQIFELYTSGSGLRKIAVLLNEMKVPSPMGKQWNNITVKKILKQEKYLGDILWQKTYSVFMGEHDKINRGDVDSFYIQGSHPAIIDRETFNTAQEIMSAAAEASKPKGETVDCFLRGKVRCTCGHSYYRIKAVNDYWQCTARTGISNKCDNRIVYHDELMAAWRRFCRKLKAHSDELLTPVLIQLEMMEDRIQGTEIRNREERADDLRQRRYVLIKLFTEGCIDLEKKISAESEIEAELDEINRSMEKISNAIDDTSEQVETVMKAVITVPGDRLAEVILDHAVVEDDAVVFYLNGGLRFKEVL